MSKIELIDYVANSSSKLLVNKKIDGVHKQRLYNHMQANMSTDVVDRIFSNAYKALNLFASPEVADGNLSKILCLGKVQSGKTAFFITTTAVAFDNGYQISYILGGTKTALLNQNYIRATGEFSNDSDIVVLDIKKIKYDDIRENLSHNKKIVVLVLKNAAERTNLGKLRGFVEEFSDIPSIIIDDEGDEVSPGAPKQKKKNVRAGKTHDVITEIITSPKCCTYLSVTATPQANLLLSTIDEISPDYAILVEPGEGYTGGNAYHDIMDNHHVVEIRDTDDFEDSIPTSFTDCLYFFIFACCLQRAKGFTKPYSMLVHPSSLTVIHNVIKSKIDDYIEGFVKILKDPQHVAYADAIDNIKKCYDNYVQENPSCEYSFADVIEHLSQVYDEIKTYQFNISSNGKASMKEAEDDDSLYKIYVGGNMLGRGLTIENLIVTYIYRDSKVTAIDTLYQRARWFGYKQSYFDVCKVYMTQALKRKFIATVENENDMWNSINAFLMANIQIKKFPRVFTLNEDKLILTRKSVSNTIVLARTNPGYSYDKSVWYDYEGAERRANRELFCSFFEKWKENGAPITFDTAGEQTHYVIEMSYRDFYESFLSQYHFPKGSKFGARIFQNMLDKVKQNQVEDKVYVMIMRYKTHQQRSLIASGQAIKELPQGSNASTNYDGDKNLRGFTDKFYMQLHLVYHDHSQKEDFVPMLALNNPITQFNVKFVTGDNDYETV